VKKQTVFLLEQQGRGGLDDGDGESEGKSDSFLSDQDYLIFLGLIMFPLGRSVEQEAFLICGVFPGKNLHHQIPEIHDQL